MRSVKFLAMVSFLFSLSFSMDSKTLMHIVSVPVIDGAGIYSSVRCLQTSNTNNKAAAITNLSLLGVNGAMGATTMILGKSGNYGTLRLTHRIIGCLVTGASLWMTISAATDKDIRKIDKGVSAGYTALTVVPILLFSF